MKLNEISFSKCKNQPTRVKALSFTLRVCAPLCKSKEAGGMLEDPYILVKKFPLQLACLMHGPHAKGHATFEYLNLKVSFIIK